jgi:hypothetical protein
MDVVPEMIVVVILVVFGINTRNISKAYARLATAEDEPLKHVRYPQPWNQNGA